MNLSFCLRFVVAVLAISLLPVPGFAQYEIDSANAFTMDSLKALQAAGADLEAPDRFGETPYMRALKGLQLEVVDALLKRGASVETSMYDGTTALMVAAITCDRERVARYFTMGASLERRTHAESGSLNALLAAATGGCADCLRLLRERGATLDVRNSMGQTPLMLAARAGSKEAVRQLLDQEVALQARDANGLSALLHAVESGSEELVRYLLRAGADAETQTLNGFNALSVAALNGYPAIAALLLDSGMALDHRSRNGSTPLQLAAREGHGEVVRLLLARGAAPDTRTRPRGYWGHARTPLRAAAMAGYGDIVDMLLAAGATIDPNDAGAQLILSIVATGDSAILRRYIDAGVRCNVLTDDSISSLDIAVDSGHVAVARLLIEAGADLEYCHPDQRRQPPLARAAYLGDCAMVAMLAEKGAEVNRLDSVWKRPPLEYAADSGRVDCVRALLAAGADPLVSNRWGQMPIRGALKHGHMEVAGLLAEAAGDAPNVCGDSLETERVLHDVVKGGHVAAVQFLLDRGVDPHTPHVQPGTALIAAARVPSPELVELLLARGLDPDVQDDHETTPLMGAAMVGSVESVALLLDAGVSVDARDDDGRTALFNAALGGHDRCARLLAKAGASVEVQVGSDEVGVVGVAATRGRFETVRLLRKLGAPVLLGTNRRAHARALVAALHKNDIDMTRLLLEHKVSPQEAVDDTVPLCAAIRAGSARAVELLLKHGAKPNRQEYLGYSSAITPLVLAAQRGHTDIVTLLLKHGADVNLAVTDGELEEMTPVMAAAAAHDSVAARRVTQIVTQLVESGADIHARDAEGRTALLHAVQTGRAQLAKLLLEKGARTDIVSSDEQSLWEVARRSGNSALVQLVEHAGAQPVESSPRPFGSEDRPYPLQVGDFAGTQTLFDSGFAAASAVASMALFNAVEQGWYDYTRLLLEQGVSPSEGVPAAPLHRAASRGNLDMVKLLLDKGAAIDAVEIEDRATPLILALQAGHADIARLLIERGAAIDQADRKGYTPLLAAVSSGMLRCVKMLAGAGAALDATTQPKRSYEHRETALSLALPYPEVLAWLLDNGAQVNARVHDGATVAILAAHTQKRAALRLLIERDADIHVRDSLKRTVLSEAVGWAGSDFVRTLLAKRADLEAVDGCGRTVLMAALHNPDTTVLELLLARGADVSRRAQATQRDDSDAGMTPLMLAVRNGSAAHVRVLLRHGADPNAIVEGERRGYRRSREPRTALEYALEQADMALVSLLVEHGAAVVCAGEHPDSALVRYVQGGVIQLAREAVRKGASPDACKSEYLGRRKTVLARAAENLDSAMVAMLLEVGADPNGVDTTGAAVSSYRMNSPVGWAVEGNAYEARSEAIVRLLLEQGACEAGRCSDLHAVVRWALARKSAPLFALLLERVSTLPRADSITTSLLVDACQDGDTALVRVALDAGADVNGAKVPGIPLASAVESENEALVRMLLTRGADVNRADSYGQTPLMGALRLSDSPEIVNALIAHGADVTQTDHDGRTLLWLVEDSASATMLIDKGVPVTARDRGGRGALHAAAERGNAELVAVLLGNGADPNAIDTNGVAPLHEAAATYGEDIIPLLLDADADVDIQNRAGETPLLVAAKRGRTQYVRLLVDRGADLDAVDGSGRGFIDLVLGSVDPAFVQWLIDEGIGGETFAADALVRAARDGNTQLLRHLLEAGVDPNAKNRFGFPAVVATAKSYSPAEVFEILVEYDVDINAADRNGVTAMLAGVASSGNARFIDYLVEHGAAVEVAESRWGMTPLMIAAARGDPEIVERLLAHGANVASLDTYGWSALVHACRAQDRESARLLLQAGSHIEQADRYGWTPLWHVVKSESLELMMLLLEQGANPNTTDTRGRPAFNYALDHGKLAAAMELFEAGADARFRDARGKTTLMHLAEAPGRNSSYFLSKLLEYGVEIDAGDQRGRTALHYAAAEGKRRFVSELLEHGADRTLKDKGGETAYDIAERLGFSAVVKLLREEPQR